MYFIIFSWNTKWLKEYSINDQHTVSRYAGKEALIWGCIETNSAYNIYLQNWREIKEGNEKWKV